MTAKLATLTAALLAALPPALAAQQESPALVAPAAAATPAPSLAHTAISLMAGSLGLGLEANHLLTSRLGVRLGGYMAGFSYEGSQAGQAIGMAMHLRNALAALDLYPFGGSGFHLSGGALLSGSSIRGSTVSGPDASYTFNHHDYTGADVGTLTLDLRLPRSAPYVGIGFGRPSHSGVGLHFGGAGLGLAFGRAAVVMQASRGGGNPQLASDLRSDEAVIQRSVDKVPFYPVVSILGFSVRF